MANCSRVARRTVTMKFALWAVTAAFATGAVAAPSTTVVRGLDKKDEGDCCLNDYQATYLVEQFKSILTNPDRQAANQTAQTVIADDYVEVSDSINSLAGYPVRLLRCRMDNTVAN